MGDYGKCNTACIRDGVVRNALEREAELRAELAALRQPLRSLQDKKDASIRSFQPKQEQFLNGIDAQWDELQKEKNRLHSELDRLKVAQHERQQAVDSLRMLGLEIDPIRREVLDARAKLAEAVKQMEELEERRTKLTGGMRFKSSHEADHEISRLERDIAAATQKRDQKLCAALGKEKVAAEKAKKDVASIGNVDERIDAAAKKRSTIQRELEEAQHKLEAKEAARADLRNRLDAEPRRGRGDPDDPYKKLLAKVKDISDQLDKLRLKRKESKPVNAELDDVNAEIAAHRDRKLLLAKELDELQTQHRPVTIKFDPELRADIVGRGGANVEQLQVDFGVAVLVEDDAAKIIGGKADCDTAADAFRAIVAGVKRNRQKTSVPFDMRLARGFIGTKGANVQRIENASGAELKVRQDDGEIALTGSPEAIGIAQEMISEFVANNAYAEIKYDPALRDIVIGKGGSTIRKIESESGVKRLHVDRDKSSIVITGTAEAVEKGKAAYEELIGSASAFTMRVDDRMARLLIGPKGKTINEIQDTTNTAVECRNNVITIRGTKDSIEGARRMIEEVTRREEVKVPFESCLYTTLTTRPLVAPESGDGHIQQEERPTPLEEIKQLCECDQVSAIRGESKIVVRGKQQNVNQARTMINELLRRLQPDVTRVPCPEIILLSFIKRGADKLNFLDRLKLKFTSLIHCDIDRKSRNLELAGGKAEVLEAAQEIAQHIEDAKPFILTTSVPPNAIGAVLGSGGSNVSELQRRFGVDINIDRETNIASVYSSARNQSNLEAALAAIEGLKTSARK